MPGDLHRQVLRQRAELLAGLHVQLVAGDVLGQQRIVVLRRRTLTLLVPRRPLTAIAGRPVGAFAVLRAPRSTAALERPVALSRTSFTLALELPPTWTALVALITTALERAFLRAPLGASLTLTATALEPARAPFPARPAAALAGTRRTVVGRTPLPTLAPLPREAPLSTLTTLAGEAPVSTLAALPGVASFFTLTAGAEGSAFLTLTTRTREPAVPTLAALTGEPALFTLTARTREPAILAFAALAGEAPLFTLTAGTEGSAFLTLAALAGEPGVPTLTARTEGSALFTLAALAG
ncbi:hypothetical protein, partial [Actinomadura luteofluorescens]